MGKIKKAGGPRHDATLSPALSTFIDTAVHLPLVKLPAHLSAFPYLWPFPRGDLYHWIPLLNRFDRILELFNKEYGLKSGPQTQPFARRLLERGDEDGSKDSASPSKEQGDDLDASYFEEEGDRQLVEAILVFSRLLLQSCGNRSLYSSSEHLNDLLNTSSLSLLHCTLRLAVCLAQRYHATRQRTVGSIPHVNPALLASLEKVHKIAVPFTRSVSVAEQTTTSASAPPTAKGKEKVGSADRVSGTTKVHAADFMAMIKPDTPSEDETSIGGVGKQISSENSPELSWMEWGDVLLPYYPGEDSSQPDSKRQATVASSEAPVPTLSTPGRRPSGLSQQTSLRRHHTAEHTDRPSPTATSRTTKDDLLQEHSAGAMKILQISSEKVSSTPVSQIMASVPSELPQETRYELLSRLRVASALVTSTTTRQQILGVRILAITNLAYIYPEPTFQQKVLQQDVDEPRRLQLAYQLAELVHPSGGGQVDLPRWLQTLALGALEALAKYRYKAADVCTALNINVNHGVLFYAIRTAVSEMAKDDNDEDVNLVDEEWREALFSLLAYLPTIARTGGALVSTGLLPVLLEVLTLRSRSAERVHPKVIDFLNVFIYNVRDPFQTLATSKGLDILSALVAYEVDSGFSRAHEDGGIPISYRNQLVDYELPYFQQQTLRRLFKFVNHMMSQNGLTLDRLLRNLIDSPQLLGGLQLVLTNADIFGSSIWSGAVEIISNFINNEPTSYAVIAEAGLGKAFLEAVGGKPILSRADVRIQTERQSGRSNNDNMNSPEFPEGGVREQHQAELPPDHADGANNPAETGRSDIFSTSQNPEEVYASGIPPAADAIAIVPHAFGAICLNAAGMKMFQQSGALESFFQIFLSPKHVMCMGQDSDLPKQLGNSMDELVRHHPPLKTDVITCVMKTVDLVGRLCTSRAQQNGEGAKLWVPDENGRGSVAGATQSAASARYPGQGQYPNDGDDIEMGEADDQPNLQLDWMQSVAFEEITKEDDETRRFSAPSLICAITRFLAAFFANTSACTAFIELGGAERLLDFTLLPSLPYDFSSSSASQFYPKVIHMLVEQKPHLVLPSLLKRAQAAVDKLADLSRHKEKRALFGVYCSSVDAVREGDDRGPRRSSDQGESNATALTKNLVSVHLLCNILSEVFSKPLINHRSSHSIFSQVNLADMYVRLVHSLGRLQQACVVEDILLQKEILPVRTELTETKGSGAGADGNEGFLGASHSHQGLQATAGESNTGADGASVGTQAPQSPNWTSTQTDGNAKAGVHKSAGAILFLNFQTLHYLLNHIPAVISSFFHGLGKTLVTKRLSDTFQRQNSVMVAEAIADALIDQLSVKLLDNVLDTSEKETYWLIMLTSLSRLMIEVSLERTPAQCLTLVLQAFRSRGGLDETRHILDHFARQLGSPQFAENSTGQLADTSALARLTSGIDVILNFYLHIVTSKNILEATQTAAMASRGAPRDKPDHFSPNQFAVELKMSVFPAARALWESRFVETAADPTVKKLISILHAILDSENDQGAYKRSDNIPSRARSSVKLWKEPAERREKLLSNGYSEDVVREALYRCNDNPGLAEDYCKFIERHRAVGRNPIPESASILPSTGPQSSPTRPTAESGTGGLVEPSREDNALFPPSAVLAERSTPNTQHPMETDNAEPVDGDVRATPRTMEASSHEQAEDNALLAMSIDNLPGSLTDLDTPLPNIRDTPHDERLPSLGVENEAKSVFDVVTLDDLEERRTEIRQQVIDRSLDVLNVHSDVTFELADLITMAVSNASNSQSLRAEIGETLVQSIMSLQIEDDFRPAGKKIAAYAHLLALILRDKQFRDAALKELKDNLSTLLGFVKIFPDQSLEGSSPWIGPVLLILERLLAGDAQPRQIQWTPPTSMTAREASPIAEIEEPVVSKEHSSQLLNSLLEVMPRIGKDSSLALSVVRVLVILTRDRQLATRLGERRNLQRLFVMVKQLAGLTTGKLQSAFMLVLRHIVEDEDIIRRIMRAAIRNFFDSRPSSRQIDTNGYVRGLSPFILRAPEIFVEVSNSMLELIKFDGNQRQQFLTLKQTDREAGNDGLGSKARTQEASDAETRVDDETDQAVPVQVSQQEGSEKRKPSPVENKSATGDSSDGVIHYLICELLSYKEVEDKVSAASPKELADQHDQPSSTADLDMTDTEDASTATTGSSSLRQPPEMSRVSSSATFKAEQHPIFIYRCFILQCMSELLSSYTRTKLDFVNFLRKTVPHPKTTLKPRSAVLNYFLTDLIPIGTLSHTEDVNFRKKYSASYWAISTIVSLCSKTGENCVSKDGDSPEKDDEPDLVYVRKFVLEHSLKAYRDAIASTELLDVKYARILSLADLFNRMLIGTPLSGGADANLDALYASQKLLAKLMFEKNYIPTFTASIAEIDLNYPLAKRAVKYILRPLKLLTQTAIDLSETSDMSSVVGPSEEDEISSATSASEVGEGREETPDLFRNSTLGLFEPGREADSTSASSEGDNELYEDEYGDEMDYEDAFSAEESDEDEEISNMEGLPGDVDLDLEVVLNTHEDHAGSNMDDQDSQDADSDDVDAADDMNADANDDAERDDNEEWESDIDEDDYEGDEDLADEHESSHGHLPHHHHHHHHHHSHRHDSPLEHIVRALEGEDGSDMLQHLSRAELNMDLDPDGFLEDDMQEDEDLSEQDDDEDDLEDEEEVMYDPGFDDMDMPSLPWAWNSDASEPVLSRGHTHPGHHRIPGPWSFFAGGHRDPGMFVPTYRSHRPLGPTDRAVDDGTHPLLQRSHEPLSIPGPGREAGSHVMSDWMHALSSDDRRRGVLQPDIPASLINNLISAIGHGGPAIGGLRRHGGALHFHVSGPPPRAIHRDMQDILGIRRSSGLTHENDPARAINFIPVSTSGRWQAESHLLFGQEFFEKAYGVVNAMLRVLVPLAIEKEQIQRDKKAAEDARKAQEEKDQQAERERLANAQIESQTEERSIEDRRAGEAAEMSMETSVGMSVRELSPEIDASNVLAEEALAQDQGDAMEGVEATPAETRPEVSEPGPSVTTTARVRTTIRGRELDITGMDIDPEYLDALPEELREEVLMHQIAEQRSQAATAGEQPTNISREFLEALPDDIREELLEQEAQDRRRREREDARRRAAANSGPAQSGGDDMDPASVLATLDPGLRQAILLEQDEDVLAQLPQEIAAEARALESEHRLRHHFIDPGRINRARTIEESHGQQDINTPKPQRRKVVQMLDKAGIATLLRLMFIPQQGSARHTLNGILQNICENKQNRTETVSLLLSILQDGSADVAAIDRSFAQLSLRARQPASQKLLQAAKRSQDQLSHGICDTSPLAVVQQCLNTLVLLVQYNPHLQSFFLTEHDPSTGLKRAASKKGKAKDNKASRYALNSLLGLLDRKLVMESPTVMEQLSTLLNSVTQPLNILLRKEKGTKVATPEGNSATESAQAPGNSTMALPEASGPASQLPDADRGLVTLEQASRGVTDTEPAAQESNPNPGLAPEQTNETSKGFGKAKLKKERSLEPPLVPENNLRLVVNILTARECSAKTFRDTLSMINSLSAIPGAKKVFGMELIRQAQSMGQSILSDLSDLLSQINNAQTDTDVQGLALVKFSPASSPQAKLLRVLTALDYLFDTQRESGKTNPSGLDPDADSRNGLKRGDILSTLSNDSTFGPLWSKLSECLSAIRQKEHMLNLATILLPLVEALMVVCKNTALRTSASKRTPVLEGSSPIENDIPERIKLENLFFKFTEEHRKILNDLVRHNPKLMSGTFSLLVKNPKVLEFDNKRSYFTRRLHIRGTETRHTQPPLQLSVRRDQVFLDSFKSLYFKSGEEMKYGKLSIRFHGEEGVDAGGVTREWFQVLSRQMFNPDYALFTPVAADRTTFHPNRLSAVNPEHYMFFKFIGRVIGKALYEGRVLDCHFSRAVYKRILGKPVSVKDMETLDLDYYKSLIWMLENDITDIITETFSVESEAFGESQIIDLKENGRNIPVTEANKQEYVRLVVEYRLTGSVNEQVEHFLTGFHDIVPAELISIFNEQELELLISGLPDIDVDDWKNNTEYHNYSASSPQIQWFWRAVRSFDKEERAKLLQFVTGTSKVPLNGFKELEGMNGFSRFNIHRDYASKERLPSSHTCFNQLDLPEYESYESLRQHVYTAMTAGSEYFGFA